MLVKHPPGCKLLYIEWISNKVLLYNTGNYILYLVINIIEKNIYIYRSHFAIHQKVKVLIAQLCSTLCNPMDCSPPGSVHGILQSRILEWVAIPFSKGFSQPRDGTLVSCIAGQFFYCLSHLGSPSRTRGGCILMYGKTNTIL